MKPNLLYKIIIYTGFILIICWSLYFILKEPDQLTAPSSTDDFPPSALNHIGWLKRFPQLQAVPAESQTANIKNLKISESVSQLIGPIDNPYGVRNDVLAQILAIVPESNPRMLKAAIKAAYYDNLLAYSPTESEQLYYLKKWSLAHSCAAYFDSSENLTTYQTQSQAVEKLMRNTPARKKYNEDFDKNVLGWKTLGTGLSQAEEEKKCLEGDY